MKNGGKTATIALVLENDNGAKCYFSLVSYTFITNYTCFLFIYSYRPLLLSEIDRKQSTAGISFKASAPVVPIYWLIYTNQSKCLFEIS